jgi:ABC-type transport system substrate-binding protein
VPARGGVLTVLLDPEPPTLLTLTTTAGVSYFTSSKTNEGLLTYDFGLNPWPQLATSWSVSPDGLQYTFKLRPGVRWHDGQDFTAADVAFSIATLKEVHPRGRSTIANVANISTQDALTVVLTRFRAPDLPLYPLDLKRAEQLLDEAGYPRVGGAPRLKLVHDPLPYGEPFRRAGDFIRVALGRIGIDVTIRSQDFATYIHRVYTDRDFDFTFNSMSNLFDPTVGVQRLYWSKNFRVGVPFSNGAHYDSPDADRLLEAAAVEIDPAKRLQEFIDFQRQVIRDLPDITIASVYSATIADRKVIDHTLTADGIAATWRMSISIRPPESGGVMTGDPVIR